MNPWVELLVEVKQMRQNQKDYFKKKDKLAMAKAKLCEMKVDQLTGKLEEICREKGINITQKKPEQQHEPTE